MALYGYVRCSTDKQKTIRQRDALRAVGRDRIFQDKGVRATQKNRPALIKLRKLLRPGDTFCITEIDRGFRSTFEAIAFLDDIQAENVTFRILVEKVDTRTPEGRHWFIVKAADAEYEREKISRRTREYMAAAKRRGQKFGRPRKLNKTKIARARKALSGKNKKTLSQVAKRLRVSPRTLTRALSGIAKSVAKRSK